MRVLLLGLLLLTACERRYTWAFGEDVGAAAGDDWKGKPCSEGLARTLYAPGADSLIAAKKGNRFFFPGQPGHFYYVHGFHSQEECERARAEVESRPRR
jgi:hypothetical protein